MFKVPEQFRSGGPKGETNGWFGFIPSVVGDRRLCVLATNWLGWEHVSVHAHAKRSHLAIPSWEEMCQIKDLFWDEEDAVVQFHPPRSRYVVLHLWRPLEAEIPLPDPILFGLLGDHEG